MNKICAFTALMLVATAPAQAALTLKESFQSARLNMESIKRADATIEQSEAFKSRARAAILPTVSGVGSLTEIDRPNAAGSSPFLLTRQHSAAIRFSQPLLRGGSLSAYDLAKDTLLLSRYQKDATEINLYQLVINSYYNLNIAQVDKQNVEILLKFSRERVKEIADRAKIGRSRKGELVEAEAQLLTAESQYQQTLIRLEEAERTFEFYTKLKPGVIEVPTDVPKLQGTLSEYLLKVRDRPDIQATRQQARVAERQISIAKGGHYPSLDLTGNYYLSRTGVLETSDWDVGLAVVIPLYQGGGVSAAIKEAAQGKRIAELNSSEAQRAAERDVTINFQNIVHLTEQVKILKKALAKAEEAYKLNKKDYQYGLVTNLDVLQSLNIFIETKRSYTSLVSIAHLNYKNLEAATGVLP